MFYLISELTEQTELLKRNPKESITWPEATEKQHRITDEEMDFD